MSRMESSVPTKREERPLVSCPLRRCSTKYGFALSVDLLPLAVTRRCTACQAPYQRALEIKTSSGLTHMTRPSCHIEGRGEKDGSK